MKLMSNARNTSYFEQSPANNEDISNFSNQNVLIGAIIAIFGNILISLAYQVSIYPQDPADIATCSNFYFPPIYLAT